MEDNVMLWRGVEGRAASLYRSGGYQPDEAQLCAALTPHGCGRGELPTTPSPHTDQVTGATCRQDPDTE